MAKKNKETKVEEPVVEETVVMEEPKVKTPKVKVEPKKPKWEVKDRVYYLRSKRKPLSYSVRSSNLFWFDEEAGFEREIKYCQNQRTVFVDEMKGEQRLEHIIFKNGSLYVYEKSHKFGLFDAVNKVSYREQDNSNPGNFDMIS